MTRLLAAKRGAVRFDLTANTDTIRPKLIAITVCGLQTQTLYARNRLQSQCAKRQTRVRHMQENILGVKNDVLVVASGTDVPLWDVWDRCPQVFRVVEM